MNPFTWYLLGLQSRFEDKLVKFLIVCPKNGTAVLRGLRGTAVEQCGGQKAAGGVDRCQAGSRHRQKEVRLRAYLVSSYRYTGTVAAYQVGAFFVFSS